MNRIITYFFLLLLYLTLSKSLSPSELSLSYVNAEANLDSIILGEPVTAILADIHSTGFVIKTYYLKLKVVYGLKAYEEVIVRTSRSFKEKYTPFIGMSIFRRASNQEVADYTPLPPGTVFIGDSDLGRWVQHPSGERVWKFYRVYRQLPIYLGWGEFLPTYSFLSKSNIYLKQGKPFFGLKDEFGLNGPITRKEFSNYFERQKEQSIDFKKFITNYFQNNFIQTGPLNE